MYETRIGSVNDKRKSVFACEAKPVLTFSKIVVGVQFNPNPALNLAQTKRAREGKKSLSANLSCNKQNS